MKIHPLLLPLLAAARRRARMAAQSVKWSDQLVRARTAGEVLFCVTSHT
jgi:hypothetical protein